MRVITGKARGVALKTPDGMTTRPTTDRVKEALFSIIQFDIPCARVLDLFGGTGLFLAVSFGFLSTGTAPGNLPRSLSSICQVDPRQ